MRTVTSDCLADKFGGRLEISTIRLRGWLCGSNHRPLPVEGHSSVRQKGGFIWTPNSKVPAKKENIEVRDIWPSPAVSSVLRFNKPFRSEVGFPVLSSDRGVIRGQINRARFTGSISVFRFTVVLYTRVPGMHGS